MSTATAEQKLIQKLVSVLSTNPVIKNMTEGRVYSSHPSTIDEPVFPAVSLFLLNSAALFSPYNHVQVDIQIDTWLPGNKFNMNDVMNMHRKIRELLHRQFLSDKTLSLIVSECVEKSAGPLMFEEDTGLYHYPVSYSVRAS